MVTMRTPKGGVSYSEALAAAYASAPEDEIILDTLEFNHPAFQDDTGAQIAIRVVNDFQDLIATLEADAPMNPGATVTFKKSGFEFRKPTEDSSGALPEVELQVDNISRYIVPYLDQIKESRNKITMIWRPYCVSDLTGPHINPPLQLTLKSVSATMLTMTARAGFLDISNRRFPASEYTSKKFPGLTAR